MTQFKQEKNSKSRVNRARRHFLGLAATVTARAAALGALAATILPSSANAQRAGRGRGPIGGGGGRPGRPGHGHGGGPGQGGGAPGPACFLRGTSILTSTGEVRIEELRIGDLVVTAGGQALPVQWIGRNIYRRSGASWPEDVVPIRVRRGALADRTPHTDLYLSPNHALFIDGVLIRVKELVNGTSITPAVPDDGEVIEYFNLMLATHEVILAEGVPTETFLLRGRNYEVYTNFVEYERLYPGSLAVVMAPHAPIVGYEGGWEHLKALLNLAASPFIRVHDPVQDAYRKLAARAERLVS